MVADLDEFFSPERLRGNWLSPVSPVSRPNAGVLSAYLELLRQIDLRFPGETRLAVLLDELAAQMSVAFPPDAVMSVADADQRQAIAALLEQLEELLWALQLPVLQEVR